MSQVSNLHKPINLPVNTVHVAVGVIFHQHKILISKRLNHLHQGGKWEFPGGKVEAGESVEQALQRELFEELDIHINVAKALFCIPFSYPDKKVALEIYLVEDFSGSVVGKEGQPLRWIELTELSEYSFPQANQFIVEFLLENMA